MRVAAAAAIAIRMMRVIETVGRIHHHWTSRNRIKRTTYHPKVHRPRIKSNWRSNIGWKTIWALLDCRKSATKICIRCLRKFANFWVRMCRAVIFVIYVVTWPVQWSTLNSVIIMSKRKFANFRTQNICGRTKWFDCRRELFERAFISMIKWRIFISKCGKLDGKLEKWIWFTRAGLRSAVSWWNERQTAKNDTFCHRTNSIGTSMAFDWRNESRKKQASRRQEHLPAINTTNAVMQDIRFEFSTHELTCFAAKHFFFQLISFHLRGILVHLFY